MQISPYTAFFHDGSILNIKKEKNKIEIYMESAEISQDDLDKQIALSKEETIKGILHFEEIKQIKINDEIRNNLKMLGDSGEILELKIKMGEVNLFIEWVNYSSNPPKEKYMEIKIIADKMSWENLANKAP